MVLLAITVNLLWGRLLMVFFVAQIAALDAHVVALVVHTSVQGNRVLMLDGHHMSIIQACTSVENASVALMMFVAIVRTFRPTPRPSEWLYLAGIFAFVVALNDARLSLMARSMEMFQLVHGPVSWVALDLIFTAAGLVGAALSVRALAKPVTPAYTITYRSVGDVFRPGPEWRHPWKNRSFASAIPAAFERWP